MPPSRTAPKSHVYAITRRDFNHHTDSKGSLVLVEIHASLPSANAAAKIHLTAQSFKGSSTWNPDPEIEEQENRDGRYDATCYTREDRRDNFRVEVKKMELKGGKLAEAGAAPPKAKMESKGSKLAETGAAPSKAKDGL